MTLGSFRRLGRWYFAVELRSLSSPAFSVVLFDEALLLLIRSRVIPAIMFFDRSMFFEADDVSNRNRANSAINGESFRGHENIFTVDWSQGVTIGEGKSLIRSSDIGGYRKLSFHNNNKMFLSLIFFFF